MKKDNLNAKEFKRKLTRMARDYDEGIKNNFDALRKRVSKLEKEIEILKHKI